MKKLCSTLFLTLCCACLLVLSGCSCLGGSGSDQPGQDHGAMSWQDNYDLGIRLLAEGNYEEAILAFQAAIQIDPKRVENYIYLADAYIGAGNYDAAADVLMQGREHVGPNEAFDRLQENLEFLQSNMVGIRITNLHFDRASFLSGQETDFMVSVVYRCPDNVDCVLMIGTNIDEPYSYAMMNQDWPVSGGGTYSFYISDTPVFWEESSYSIYVNMSEADHSDTWTPLASDILDIDADGNVTGSNFGPMYDDPYDGESNDEPEHPLATLFAADPDAGLTIEELTLFGIPIKGLSYDDACAIAAQNSFPRYIHSDPTDDYYALYQGESDPSIHLYPNETSVDGSLGTIAYLHYMTFDDAGSEIRDPETTPVWTGIRDIYTYDSLNDVIAALGYSNSEAITSYIQSILSLPAPEADTQLRMLWSQGWCCDISGVTASGDSDEILYWSFTWYGEDSQTQHLYSVMFEFHVSTDSLTHVTISIY